MSQPSDEPADLGLAAVDAAASTGWLPFTGLVVGLIPMVVLVSFVLLAVEGVVVAASVFVLGAIGVVLLSLRRPHRPAGDG